MANSKHRIHRLADWHRIKGTYGVETPVDATVLRHVGFGAVCSVGNQRILAKIRKVEIDWDPKRQLQQTIPEGTTFRGIVVGHDDERRELILSRKAIDPSPFTRFVSAHGHGEVVEATLERRTPAAWILRLSGGLSGRLPDSEVPSVPEFSTDLTAPFELKIGDYVKVSVKQVDVEEKEIVLSLRDAVQRTEQEWCEWVANGRAKSQMQRLYGQRSVPGVPPAEPNSDQLRIFLVDDEEGILFPLTALLKDRTHLVTASGNLSVARRALATAEHIDVAVIDLQLSGESGVELLEELRCRFPLARRIVLTADLNGVPDNAANTDILRVEKPVDPAILIAIVEGNVPAAKTSFSNVDQVIDRLSQSDYDETGENKTVLRLIDSHLRALSDGVARASLAVLRHIRATNEIVCLRSKDVERKRFEPFSAKLRFSMIGDVLGGQDFGHLKLNPFTNSPDSLIDLMRSLQADRVFGVRLRTRTLNDPIGVFAFFRVGSEPQELQAIRAFQQQAEALALAIDRSVLDARIVQHQRALSAGSLLLGMTHELKNTITALRFQATQMQSVLESTHQIHEQRHEDSLQCAASLMRQTKDLEIVFESLLGMTRCQSVHQRPLTELVLDVIRQCHPTAEKENITLWSSNRASSAASTHFVPSLLAQVAMNLVLNAIQHTRAFRQKNGFVHVTVSDEVEDEVEDERRWICVRVTDNAFGIDGASFHKIFRMFETTRRDGSGLGLYVSRMIIDGLNGELTVESSYKFHGTTMAIRIPIS